jgi:uncharacterized protein
LTEANWRENAAYLYGIDLFNYQYYWEAHEAWEELWRLEDKRSDCALLLRGLIQIAAQCIKRRENNARGVEKLRDKAWANLAAVGAKTPYMGLDLGALCRLLDSQHPNVPRLALSY